MSGQVANLCQQVKPDHLAVRCLERPSANPQAVRYGAPTSRKMASSWSLATFMPKNGIPSWILTDLGSTDCNERWHAGVARCAPAKMTFVGFVGCVGCVGSVVKGGGGIVDFANATQRCHKSGTSPATVSGVR